jgi:hypothetical protein
MPMRADRRPPARLTARIAPGIHDPATLSLAF